MRKLVTLRTITNILPIEGADRIEEVQIDGWSVVSQKGIHTIGDNVLYFEIDSFLPESDLRFESFMKFGTRKFNDVVGHKIKTIRLKGVYSQGIIMPIGEFPEVINPQFDTDYSELIGVVKWEAPEFTAGAGKFGDAKGNFPHFMRKTDQERIQNLYGKLKRNYKESLFVGTLKMDGSSIQVAYVEGERYDDKGHVICSRNLELKYDQEIPFEEQGCFIKGAINSDLFNKARQLHEEYGSYYAIQGELVGAGIQSNFEKFQDYTVFAYNIFDIVKQDYVPYNMFEEMCLRVNIKTVPVVESAQHILNKSVQEIVKMADGKGLRADYREGVVWREWVGTCSFKAVSNKYLGKEE